MNSNPSPPKRCLRFFRWFCRPDYLEDFKEFARRIGISERRIDTLLNPFVERQSFVETLINRSFLDDPTNGAYLLHYQTKRNQLAG